MCGYDNGNSGPLPVGGEGDTGGKPSLDHIIRRLGAAVSIYQAKAPFLDETVILEKWVRPTEDHRSCESVIENFLDLPVQKTRLPVRPMAKAAHPKLSKNQGQFTGQVLKPGEICAELRALVQVNVKGVDINKREFQVFRRGEIGIGYEAVGILLLGYVI